jgi:hypothetical protein
MVEEKIERSSIASLLMRRPPVLAHHADTTSKDGCFAMNCALTPSLNTVK